MSQFHSMVSRRQFMKALGLAGAGIGATAAVAPMFKDLDALAADTSAGQRYPWWVKQREAENPTTEIDWSLMERFDASKCVNGGDAGFLQYVSKDDGAASLAQKAARYAQWTQEARPGFTIRDRAIRDAASGVSNPPWTTPIIKSNYAALGVPRWQGTPEENSRMLRSALKFFGATSFGITALTPNIKEMVYTKPYSAPFLDFVFEDVDLAYETTAKQVIPTKNPMWIVTIMSPASLENMKTGPGPLSSRAATGSASTLTALAINRAQGFLGILGYQCVAGTVNGVGATAGFASLSGIAEVSRRGDAVSSDFGMCMRGQKFLTDMPLAPTDPVDSGIWKFCASCKKCAAICPSGAISFESDTTWDVTFPWQAKGTKKFQFDGLKCQRNRNDFGDECGLCMGGCVFSKHSSAMIHDVVKATITTTPLFNGFFRSMDDRFGYRVLFNGSNNPTTGAFNDEATKWWDRELSTFGFDFGKPM